MSTIRVKIAGQQVGEPEGWREMKTTVDFTNDSELTISLDRIKLFGASARLVIDYLETNGYYQGIPFEVQSGDPQSPSMTIDGFLDPADDPIITNNCEIEIAVKRRQGKDWLVEMADSFSYRELSDVGYTGLGKITVNDYTRIPYIINYIPDGMQLIILGISTFMLAKELVDSIKRIANQTVALVKQVVPNTGTAGPIPVVSWSLGQVVGAIITLALEIVYVIGIIVALVKLVEQIIEELAPLKRFHLGMGLKNLVLKGCERLGLTLKSDLLDSLDSGQKWVVMPTKGHRGGEAPTGADKNEWVESGVPNANDGMDSFGQVIRFIETTFNAKYWIIDGVFEIERKDYKQGLSSYVLPNTLTEQDTLQNKVKFNTGELYSNVVIAWGDDPQDQNTIDNTEGRIWQAVTYVDTVTDPNLVNLKGINRINIPMSLGVRKNELTAIEKVLKVFLQAADFLSGQLDEPQSFASKFNARIGSLHLSSHFTGSPKMVVMEGNKLATNQRGILSAKNLWDNQHFIDSFVTIDNKNAQQAIYKQQLIPFCDADLLSLQNNHFVTNIEGETVEVEKIEWTNYENSALVDYRVYRIYDENLDIKYLRK